MFVVDFFLPLIFLQFFFQCKRTTYLQSSSVGCLFAVVFFYANSTYNNNAITMKHLLNLMKSSQVIHNKISSIQTSWSCLFYNRNLLLVFVCVCFCLSAYQNQRFWNKSHFVRVFVSKHYIFLSPIFSRIFMNLISV